MCKRFHLFTHPIPCMSTSRWHRAPWMAAPENIHELSLQISLVIAYKLIWSSWGIPFSWARPVSPTFTFTVSSFSGARSAARTGIRRAAMTTARSWSISGVMMRTSVSHSWWHATSTWFVWISWILHHTTKLHYIVIITFWCSPYVIVDILNASEFPTQ